MTELHQTLATYRASIQRKVHAREDTGPLISAIDRAINDAYARIMAYDDWQWARAEGTFITYPPMSQLDGGGITVGGTGNVELTTALPIHTTVGKGWVIQEDVRRNISAATASGPGSKLTLAVGWTDTGALATYSLYCLAYNLSSLAIGKIVALGVIEDTTRSELEWVETTSFIKELRDDLTTGVPEYYAILRYSASGYPIIGFHPIPDAAYQMIVDFYRRPQKLVNLTDSPIIPPQWHHVVEEGALAGLYQEFFHDPATAMRQQATFERSLIQMQREMQGSTRQIFRMGQTLDNVREHLPEKL